MANANTMRDRQKAESTRRIIESAVLHFGRDGYTKASLSAIAKDAGVVQSVVSSRFGSKEGLLAAAYRATTHAAFEELEGPADSRERLIAAFEEVRRMQSAKPDSFAFIRTVLVSTDLPEGFLREKTDRFYGTAIEQCMLEEQSRGLYPQGDAYDLFLAFFALAFCRLDICSRYALPVPDGDFFLASIGYSGGKGETTVAEVGR